MIVYHAIIANYEYLEHDNNDDGMHACSFHGAEQTFNSIYTV